MDRNRTSGFTLIEVIIVIAVMGIMMAIATPNVLEWSRGMKYKEVARNLASAMRDARSRAIATNREQEILVDVNGDGKVTYDAKDYTMPRNGYILLQGNFANSSTIWNQPNLAPTVLAGGNMLMSKQGALTQLQLKSGKDCDVTTDVQYQFNPDGTSSSFYVCVYNSTLPAAQQRQWRVGIKSSSSGRIEITR